jgi:magnesium-transporting ATPase (P-type)
MCNTHIAHILARQYNIKIMVNPFDRNFFKFFVGFVCILAVSFGVLYIVGTYTNSADKRASVIQK